jgi:hypothetical protein
VIGSQEKVTDPETGLTIAVRKPIASQVSMAVRRGIRYAALRARPNRDKRLAIVFYDYPAGKANIGASYLNVSESIAAILQRLAREGYDVGKGDLSATAVLKELSAKARNIGGYAPGDIAVPRPPLPVRAERLVGGKWQGTFTSKTVGSGLARGEGYGPKVTVTAYKDGRLVSTESEWETGYTRAEYRDGELVRAVAGSSRERLSQHEFPRVIAFVSELPKTPAGKVNRRVLRDREAAERVLNATEEQKHADT